MQYTPLDESNGSSGNDHDSVKLTVASGDDDNASFTSSSRRKGVPKHLSEPLTSPPDVEIADDDPFYVFREDLYRKLELVDESLTRYLRIVQQTDTAVNTHELKDAKKQLKRHIKNAESTLKDVNTTVQLVSNNPERFPNITNSELFDRKTLVQSSQDRLTSVKAEMHSDSVKNKLLKDERAKTLRRMQMEDDDAAAKENSSFIADSHAKASLLMQQQDETLDELDEAVTRVGIRAEEIHEEIGLQNKMLNEMEEDLTDAEEKLGLVMGKLAKMLKTKDKCQLGTILALSFTVLVLFFLVIYT